MRKFAFAVALFGATFGLSELAAAKFLTVSDCRPLTPDNARECCAAANWKSLIPSSNRAICNRSELNAPVAESPLETTADIPDTLDPNPPGQTATIGNPGNEPAINGPDKEVGNAGENPAHDGGGGFGDSEANGNSQ